MQKVGLRMKTGTRRPRDMSDCQRKLDALKTTFAGLVLGKSRGDVVYKSH